MKHLYCAECAEW